MRKAAALGYDGVEVAVGCASDLRDAGLREALLDTGLSISSVSTGQLSAVRGLSLSHPDVGERRRAVDAVAKIIEGAAGLSDFVNIGRVRGCAGSSTLRDTEERFLESAHDLCDRADACGVRLLLEPVNRYEIDFINTLPEGAALVERIGRRSMALMPDLFHMNIEDADIETEIERCRNLIGYVHLADSNRKAPGMGHLDFVAVKRALDSAGFRGWTAVEILPFPDPDSAARTAIARLRACGYPPLSSGT